MKGYKLLSATALTIVVFAGALAQKSTPSTTLTEESVRTVAITGRAIIHHVDLRGDFQPAQDPAPYIYLQTMFSRLNDAGVGFVAYFPFFATIGGQPHVRTIGDDVVLMGGAPDPGQFGYDTTTPVACGKEISLILLSTDPVGGNLRLQWAIRSWTGLFGAGVAGIVASGATTITNIPPAPPQSFVLLLVTIPLNNLPLPKAFWFTVTADQAQSTINLANIGPLIANSVPGNVSMLPGRGYFRVTTPAAPSFDPLTGGSLFTGLPQGSFFLAIRGTHNFVGTIDMSTLASRAQPSDPLAFELDDDPQGDPDAGIEEGLRRNLVDVEVVNDSGTSPFTTRFTTYLDENGRFTLPVTNAIASITVRRWDNGLKVTFNRPDGGWSQSVCSPTEQSATMTFGDVNGDGVINNADLLPVLFGFGSSEQ